MIKFIGDFDNIEKDSIQDMDLYNNSIIMKINPCFPFSSLKDIKEFLEYKKNNQNSKLYFFDRKSFRQVVVPSYLSCKFIDNKLNSNLTINDTTVYIHQGCSETCICTSAYKDKFSVPYKYIKEQIDNLPQKEYIILYAINVGDYNSDGDIIDLCKKILNDYPCIKKLILSNISPYSSILSNLMKYMSSEPRILSSIFFCLNTASRRLGLLQGHDINDNNIGELSRKYKINIIPYLIAGYPTETDEDFYETLEWIKRNNLYGGILLPYIPNGVSGINEISKNEYDKSYEKLEILDKCIKEYSVNFNNDIDYKLWNNLIGIILFGEDHTYYRRFGC